MPADPNRVKDLFLAATDQPDEAARAAYLDAACGADAELRGRVEALLRAHDPAGSFLGTPAASVPDPHTAGTVAFTGPADPIPDPASDAGALSFLAPPGRPGSLGRIGHYEMLQVLGKGGFGIVFRAFDIVLERVVAVKVMAPQIAATSPARKRFLREARSAAAVRHENVVQIHEVGEHPLPYLVMEFIPGETLQQKLDRTGPLDVPEVLRIGRQIAAGLAAAHATDLIHRDIKPSNILIESGPHGPARITDFGLARAADDASISQSGIVAGTPMFMAPEQALGLPLDQRLDLFSLGSVLYQMASGRPPFRANSTVAVLKRVAEEAPRAIRELIPETPPWLCDIIAKLHAKDPADRYQSAREIADLLADCEAQLKADSKLGDFSRIPRGKARPSGRRTWAAAAAVLLLPVIAFAVTEAAGVTHLFRQQAAGDPIKPGGDPTPVAVAEQGPPPVPVPKKEKPAPLPSTFKNGIGMEFVLVPKGKSWLGGGKDRLGDQEVEFPADFYLGKYEVTQQEWARVMGENPSHFSHAGGGRDAVDGIPDDDLDRFPVESVSWEDCQRFVTKLNEREGAAGWAYRLPTEAEWEYACRGGPMADKADSAFDFYLSGPTNTLLPEQANVGAGRGLNRTCRVGSYRANALGLCDMYGNVWEWCGDLLDPSSPAPAADRVYRGGGSWGNDRAFCQTAIRGGSSPAVRDIHLGLRLARAPSGAAPPAVKTLPFVAPPFTDADVRRVAALPVAEQVEEVRRELKKRNPGFDGRVEPTLADDRLLKLSIDGAGLRDLSPVGVLAGLRLLSVHSPELADLTPLRGMGLTELAVFNSGVSDLSPLAGMKLRALDLSGSQKLTDLAPLKGVPLEILTIYATRVADLTPLAGMKLRCLNCDSSAVTDLSPLRGLPLRVLNLNHCKVSDLSLLKDLPLKELYLEEVPVTDLAPLKGMPLDQLTIFATRVADLTPLAGMKLRYLNCDSSAVSDLAPLKGMPLSILNLSYCKVQDLSPLKDVPLKELNLAGAAVTDLSPLKDVPLKVIRCDFQAARDARILRAIKTLETINGKPAAEFLKDIKDE